MKRIQAYKYELMPNGQQARQMMKFAGSCRFVFNKALALQQEWYQADPNNKFSYVKLANLLPIWKKEFTWLGESPSQALQHSLKDLERAFDNFFSKRASFPKFKKKGVKNSFRYPQGVKLDQNNNRIFLPKLGWMRYRNSRQVLGKIKNVTVSFKCNRWFVSIQTEREVEVPTPTGGIVGIDMGIVSFATLSDGSFVDPINSLKQCEDELRKAQQSLSRKVKFSRNWYKAKTKVQKLHYRIANIRRNFLHQTSSRISKNHAVVCIEDLQITNMSKSAAGTAEQHGKNVQAKSALNKAILDQGWGEFRRQLDYKLAWNGGHLITVPAQNTSRTCPACGHISAENRKTQAKFACVQCGYENNADIVGAINVLKRGEAILAAI